MKADHYAQVWEFDPARHKFALEASTGYSRFPQESGVPQRIFDYGIRPKIVYILRNPADRILSHRSFIKNKTWATSATLEHMIDVSNYYLQLTEYRKYFPFEDILLLDFDELKNDSAAVVRKAFQFLSLSNDDISTSYEVQNATRLESSFEKKIRGSALRSLFKFVPNPLRQYGNKLLSRLPTDRGSLTKAEKVKIHETLYEDMINLHNVYGVNVQAWGFDIPKGKVK